MGNAIKKQQERIKFFQTCFSELSKKKIKNFHCMFEEKGFQRGQSIYFQNQKATTLYLMAQGGVELYLFPPDYHIFHHQTLNLGHGRQISLIEQNGFFGEECLLDKCYNLTAISTSDLTKVYCIDAEKFESTKSIIGLNFHNNLKLFTIVDWIDQETQ
jgi:CRP-like cAMP-binding protein